MTIEYKRQKTVQSDITFSGVGLHSGKTVTMVLKPEKDNHGIVFCRTDIANKPKIPALYDQVFDTSLCTKIGNESVSVGTIEHLMAALAALEVDNLLIEIDGPEVPILDGSSILFYKKILETGLKKQRSYRKYIEIKKRISVAHDEAFASLEPDTVFSAKVSIDFTSKAIGQQSYDVTLEKDRFLNEIAKARTFGFKHEVDYLRSIGLALGGSLDNAVVVDGDKVLNPDGLRVDNEFVRHKTLDTIGDLYLAGAQIIGQFTGQKNGHRVNNFLLREILKDENAWGWALATEKTSEAPVKTAKQSSKAVPSYS